MLAFVDEFYSHESEFLDSVLSKEKYEQMTDGIRKAYSILLQGVDDIAEQVEAKKVSLERQDELELVAMVREAKATKGKLIETLEKKEQQLKVQAEKMQT
jgi:hypothetical protein